MKRVIYKKTGEVNKETKSFPAIMFRSKERNRILMIGNSPVEVSDREYEFLKKRHGKDIILFSKKTKLPKPMEVDISGPPVEKVKEFESKIEAKLGIPKAILKSKKSFHKKYQGPTGEPKKQEKKKKKKTKR